MGVELTKERIEGAIQQAGDWYAHPHPVIRAMYGGSEFEAMERVRKTVSPGKAEKFEKTRFSGIVGMIESMREDFTLDPLDVIGIWACTEKAPEGQQTSLARLIVARYAVGAQGSPIGSWRFDMPEYFMYTGSLLPKVTQDLPGLRYALGRVNIAYRSYREIVEYMFGPEGPDQYTTLMTEVEMGEHGAGKKLDNLIEGYYERSNPTLEGVLNTFGPEVGRFGDLVVNAIDQFQIPQGSIHLK